MFSIKLSKPKFHVLIITFCIFMQSLSGCYKPPYNDFEKEQPKLKTSGYGTAVGAVVGSVFGATFIGAVVGGSSVTALNLHKTSRETILKNLNSDGIQFVQYGDKCTLIVPTDRFYLFNSSEFNNVCYKGLNDIVRLINLYPKTLIYVAGFSDNIGDPYYNYKLSKDRAETMLTFLWAHDVPAEMLKTEGFGDKFDIGDNHLIRGGAYNRRIEIQWYVKPPEKKSILAKGFHLDKKVSPTIAPKHTWK